MVPAAAAVGYSTADVQLRQSGVDVDVHAEPRPSPADQNRVDVLLSTEGSDGRSEGIGRAGGRGRKRGRASETTGIVWTRTAMQKFDSEVDHG